MMLRRKRWNVFGISTDFGKKGVDVSPTATLAEVENIEKKQ